MFFHSIVKFLSGALFIWMLLLSFSSSAQVPADSAVSLNEVVIEGYPVKMALLKSPVSAGILDKKQLANQPGYTLVPAMNTMSGVRMEERSPGSYRLAVRGSLLRSPFGIRNIKIYMDDFLLTDAGGNSYLNLIDVGSINKVEVLKGPHGSLYGSNTGGVVRIGLFERTDSIRVQASVTGGSYGLFYQKAGVTVRWKKHQFSLYEAFQSSNGYRDNSALQRKYIQVGDLFDYHKNATLKALIFYSDLNYQTPGGLTLSQFQQNPRAARPSTATIPGAVEQQAGIKNKTIYGGLANEVQLGKRLRHVISIFGTHTDFENPFITNYEIRNETSYGARTYLELSGSDPLHSRSWKWNGGMEAQQTLSTVTDYGNRSGVRDTVQTSDELNARQYFFFTQLSVQLGKLVMEAGVSLNYYGYQYRSRLINPELPLTNRSFDPQWMPRVALSYGIFKNVFWRASVSKGYSAPTIAEVRPSDNTIHNDLQAESGWNYETGLRFKNSRIEADAVVFYYRLQNAIVQRQDNNGISYFVNAGGTVQPGFEWQGKLILLKPRDKGWIRALDVTNSVTWYHFSFSDYKTALATYSGNPLTGVPQSTVVTSVRFQFLAGFYGYGQYTYTSRISLNDQNNAYAPEYHLMQAKIGWKHALKSRYQLEVFLGADNLLNVQYSLGNDLNAVGGRYYNAAPARNYYLGAGFSF